MAEKYPVDGGPLDGSTVGFDGPAGFVWIAPTVLQGQNEQVVRHGHHRYRFDGRMFRYEGTSWDGESDASRPTEGPEA